MRRNIFYDKKIYHTETGKMSFQMTSFEEILNYFKLRNCWLNSKLCAKRKLSHSDVNTYVFFVKKEILKFVIELRNLIHWEILYPYISPLGSPFYCRFSPGL